MCPRSLYIIMYNSSFTFKQFLEEMDPTPEKTRSGSDEDSNEKEDYFDALADEQGISWSDIVKVFEGEPWVSTHFDLGEKKYKRSAWKIVPGTLSKHGADIQLVPQKGDRSYLAGNMLNKSKHPDRMRYHLDRKDLTQFLTTGWTPAVQAASGGGM